MSSKAAKVAKDVYRGYIPPGLPQHREPRKFKPWYRVYGKPRVTLFPKPPIQGYSEEPEYPPMNYGTRKTMKLQHRLDWYDKIKLLPSIDGKLYEIVSQYEHNIGRLNCWLPNYNSLPLAQHMTQTHVINSLPETYKRRSQPSGDNESAANDPKKSILLNQVKDFILRQIEFDRHQSVKGKPDFISISIRDGNRKQYESNLFIQNLLRNLRSYLAVEENPQLLDYKLDLSPSIRSWIYHSGFPPWKNKIYFKSRKDEDGNVNTILQLNGASALNYRTDTLIEPPMSLSDSAVTDLSLVPKHNQNLLDCGVKFAFGRPVTLPGYWNQTDDKFDCPHTTFLSMDCLETRKSANYKFCKELNDQENALNTQAILTAFSWLNGLSMHHGFTPYHRVEYPLTCQVITTNGQEWLFNVYQFNNNVFHRDVGGPTKNNICWSSGLLKLYENYDNGKFHDVNDEVIELLIRFLSQKTSPSYTSQLNLRPYLGDDTRDEASRAMERLRLRNHYEQRRTRVWSAHWRVPLYEKIFFRSKEGRHKIRHMKPVFKKPHTKIPDVFE